MELTTDRREDRNRILFFIIVVDVLVWEKILRLEKERVIPSLSLERHT